MSELDDTPLELAPADRQLAEQLDANRPVPSAGFRGALGRRLVALDPGYGPRPPRFRMTVALLITTGSLLLVLGAFVSVGVL